VLVPTVVRELIKGCALRKIQWNLDITKDQGNGKICSLFRGFVTSRFFFIYFTITEVKKVVRYTEDLYRGSLHRGSTVEGNSVL